MKQTTFWRCFLTQDSFSGLKHLTEKLTALASLIHVRFVVAHTMPTSPHDKLKELALIFWSVSLPNQDFTFCQKQLEQAFFYVIIARQHTDERYWYSKSVSLSVCLSVRYVPVSDENGLTYRHSFFFTVPKTKLQNLGHGVTPAPVQLQGHIVESTNRFTYLGDDIHSSERSTPDILRRVLV